MTKIEMVTTIYERQRIPMIIKVYYVSPKGSALSIADAIARECKCTKEALMPAYMPENVSLMFLGCDGAKADNSTVEFLNSLNNKRVRNAALFACSPKLDTAVVERMKSLLESKELTVVATPPFPGKGFLSGRKPGEEDFKNAAKFAAEAMAQVK